MASRAVLLASAAATLVGAKDIPLIPNSFSTTIEANIEEKNYTISLSETYDYDNNRLRMSSHKHDASSVTVCDFGKNITVTVTGNGVDTPFVCNETAATQSCFRSANRTSGHLNSAAGFLEQVSTINYTYMGGGHKVRGITCDKWVGSASMPGFRPPVAGISYNLSWYFAEPGWKVAGRDADGVFPVLAMLEGVETDNTSSTIKTFVHDYSFMDFWLAPTSGFADHHFALDPAWGCPSSAPVDAPTASADTPTDSVSCGDGTKLDSDTNKCVCDKETVSEGMSAHAIAASSALAFLPGVVLGFLSQ